MPNSLPETLRSLERTVRYGGPHLSDLGTLGELVRGYRPYLVGSAGSQSKTREIHLAIAEYVLERLRNPIRGVSRRAWSPIADVFLGEVATAWGEEIAGRFASMVADIPRSKKAYRGWLLQAVNSVDCTAQHPLFGFLEYEATARELAWTFATENLCDVHFADFIAVILPGLEGPAETEVVENLWSEAGAGDWRAAHRLERRRMMEAVGIGRDDLQAVPAIALTEELEHFNAYSLNGIRRVHTGRLIGMMLCTEMLVPDQQAAVLSGWRRVGFDDADLRYIVMHISEDVEHGQGWLERVVGAEVQTVRARAEVALGVFQHAEILTRLYDAILARLRTRREGQS